MTAIDIDGLDQLTPMAKARLRWLLIARPEQLTPPGWEWTNWLLRAGRGYGKTRCGAEDLLDFMSTRPWARYAVVAPTFSLGRDVCFEGESGVLGICPGSEIEKWNRSEGLFVMKSGAQAKVYSAEEPERLRGPQHHRAWVEELCAADPTPMGLTWMNLKMGLRLPMPVGRPQTVITTTLKSTVLIKKIMRDAKTVQTTGRTLDNRENLSEEAIAELLEKYDGTRLGRQELDGELVEDVEGALWMMELLYEIQREWADVPVLDTGCVAIDPATSYTSESDETGIVAVGATMRAPRKAYVMADWSGHYQPEQACRLAVELARELNFTTIVYEKNVGGKYVERALQAYLDSFPAHERPPMKLIGIPALDSKGLRAEPVAIRYETKEQVFHVADPRPSARVPGQQLFNLTKLEAQMTTWVPGEKGQESPDRVDAMVHAITHLLRGFGGRAGSSVQALRQPIARRPRYVA